MNVIHIKAIHTIIHMVFVDMRLMNKSIHRRTIPTIPINMGYITNSHAYQCHLE